MSLRTSAEIKAELVELRAALAAAVKGSYKVDTGQSSQSVTRDPGIINEIIHDRESELERALARESGSTGIIAMQFRRHG